MATLASRVETVAQLEKILNNPDHPQFMRAMEFVADRGHGRVAHEVTNRIAGPVVVTVRVVREGARRTSS
jgi:hypothetical protein